MSKKPKTRGMVISLDDIHVETEAGNEKLVIVEYYGGRISKRCTIKLSSWGAECVAERLGVIVKARKAHVENLQRDLAAAMDPKP